MPRKNVALLGGVPLLVRVILALKESECFDAIIVSTDDLEIADVATSAGAEVPRLRDSSLADDFTATAPVVLDALSWLATTSQEVFVTYPTAVFLDSSLISRLYDVFIRPDVEHAFFAAAVGAPVERTWKDDGLHWIPNRPDLFFARSQDLPRSYVDTGMGYWSTPDAWAELDRQQIPKSSALVVSRWDAVDIDTPEDLELVRELFDFRRGNAHGS